MTNRIMRDKLIALFDRLEREGESVLAEIISLTGSQLYGIVFRILQDDDRSKYVLQVVFSKIWSTRTNRYTSTDPLNALQAIAHRYAMTYKHVGQASLENDTLAELHTKHDASKPIDHGLSAADLDLLKQTYLGTPQIEQNQTKEASAEIKQKINSIVSRMTRGLS